ncbi:hypothetical protein MNV49_007717 [Pseudohyphozyma bogoriensis]|nr:hypothetical protein MNV49_007717 [Pseudohyphozyma bogoriensis]
MSTTVQPKPKTAHNPHKLPYKLYATIDYVYGIKTFEDRDGFTSAQAILNLCENMMNFTYLYLWKVGHAGAPLVGLVSATCTFWKTILYWLMDQQCGWCQSGHNDLKTWITLFAIPNGFWIVVPFLIIVSFTSETTRRLAMLSKLKAE